MRPNGTLPITGGALAAVRAEAGRFAISDLSFGGGTFLREHAHERACLAFVLAGSVDKRFASSAHLLGVSQAVTMPAGANHSDRFATTGARMLVIEPLSSDEDDLGPCKPLFDRISALSVPSPIGPIWRLTSELRASDSAAPLALEALVLDLVACTIRRLKPVPLSPRPPEWLAVVEERLHNWDSTPVRVATLADDIGVHPVHLARVFRVHHGVPLATYLRGLRLDWAAGQLRTTTSIADISVGAGFVDQSHFTRAFRAHTGLTPGRYRATCGS